MSPFVFVSLFLFSHFGWEERLACSNLSFLFFYRNRRFTVFFPVYNMYRKQAFPMRGTSCNYHVP